MGIYKMKQRLEQFLSAENLNKAKFADSINVARAAISHIIAGRNNPSYEFIVNTMEAYPDLNIEWLLRGKGKMYKSEKTASAPIPDTEDSLFFNSQEDIAAENRSQTSVTEELRQRKSPSGARIRKIVVFYNDGTYQEIC